MLQYLCLRLMPSSLSGMIPVEVPRTIPPRHHSPAEEKPEAQLHDCQVDIEGKAGKAFPALGLSFPGSPPRERVPVLRTFP